LRRPSAGRSLGPEQTGPSERVARLFGALLHSPTSYKCARFDGVAHAFLPVSEQLGREVFEREMATGTVKWFNETKGYGFIAPDGGGKDVFVHYSGIVGNGFRTLNEGAKVEFEVREGTKGPEATNVAIVG